MVTPAGAARTPRPVVLLFPGQGTQHVRMAAGLYGHDQAFTEAADQVLGLLGAEGRAIRDDWLARTQRIDIDDVRRAQPLLYLVDYALAATLRGLGVRPAALLGHSAGELVAATLAGVFTLDEAMSVMQDRVAAAAQLPPGGMLAAAASRREVEPYLADGVALAAVNAAAQTMLAGPVEPLRQAERRMRADGFVVRAVLATAAFHSPAMAQAAAATERSFARMRLCAPAAVPAMYSGYTGGRLTAAEATDPAFWARQLTDTVFFGPALDRLLAAEGDVLLVEAGPRQTLTTLARRHQAVRSGACSVVPLMPAKPGTPAADRGGVLAAAAVLEAEGYQLRPGALQVLRESPSGAPAGAAHPAAPHPRRPSATRPATVSH